MRKQTDQPVMHSYPGMVALITVENEGKKNIMACGWHSYLSMDPPMYGVAVGKTRYTHPLIIKAKSFAVNFLPAAYVEAIQSTGVLSGAEVNKFSLCGLTFDEGKTIRAPILHQAYIVYECHTYDIQSYGDHDWVVGKITTSYRDDNLFKENGLPNFNKLQIPLYLGRSQYYIANQTGEVKEIIVKRDES